MLASISPLGERARRQQWLVTIGWYIGASVVGASLLGAAAGGVGALLPASTAVWAVAVTLLGLVAIAADLGRIPLLSIRRQVNEDWLARYRGWVYGAGFGLQLGLGVVTIVTTASVYVTVGVELLSRSAISGALVGAAFGLARSVPILALARADRADRLRSVHLRLQRLAPFARWGTVVALAVLTISAGLTAASELA
jgi:sulfite exporter TauE/SafE